MTDLLSKGILTFFEKMGGFWGSIAVSQKPFIILDLLIVTLLFYWLYVLIRETRAWRILLGLAIIVLVMLMSKLLGLVTLNWIFKSFLTMLIVAIPVVFQPELRNALEKLGRIRLAEFPQKVRDLENIIDEIVSACDSLAKTETGALLVIKRNAGLKEYAETGTILNANLSAALLLNIFQKKAPLHDGAMIIVGNKIQAAGCLLPLDDSRLRYTLGARHRAALGISKETDALVILISEEKGNISLIEEGKIKENLSPFDLKQALLEELTSKKTSQK